MQCRGAARTTLACKGTSGEVGLCLQSTAQHRWPSQQPGTHRHSSSSLTPNIQSISRPSTPAPNSSCNLPSPPTALLPSLAPRWPPRCPPAATSIHSPPKATASTGQVTLQLTETSEGCLTETGPAIHSSFTHWVLPCHLQGRHASSWQMKEADPHPD